ncbi:MAG TPA: hypothetical protein VJ508_20000 [Saprospiraceae bacterium]|nr:hypothetical protein [Saprospiraceae bacterium]
MIGRCSLGEINDSQKEAEVFDESQRVQLRLALFPAATPVPTHAQSCGIQESIAQNGSCVSPDSFTLVEYTDEYRYF